MRRMWVYSPIGARIYLTGKLSLEEVTPAEVKE